MLVALDVTFATLEARYVAAREENKELYFNLEAV